MAVFFYDLLRTTRRGRIALLRTLYGLALLVALATLHAQWFSAFPDSRVSGRPRLVTAAEMAKFAEEFAGRFLYVQFGAVLLLAPAFSAGAIVEERQRGTLQLLQTTHLTPLQIVIGKLAARSVYMFGLLVTGLPVLALMPLWGGVAPELILTGFAVTIAGVLSLGALSLWSSARASTIRGAALGTHVIAVIACVLPPVCICVNPFVATAATFEGTPVVAWLCIGCHLALTAWLIPATARALSGRDSSPIRLRMAPTGSASVRAVPELSSEPTDRFRLYPPPAVGERPLLWKELHFSGSDAAAFFSRFVMFTTLALAFVIVPILGGPSGQNRDSFPTAVQFMVVVLFAAAIITTLLHATASVGREREQGTLDVLLTIPGGRDELLQAKWLGSILYSRAVLIVVAAVLIAGVVGAGLDSLILPLFAMSAAAQLAFTASLGVYLSVAVRGTGRAAFVGAAVALLVSIVPAVVCPCGYLLTPPVWLFSQPAAFADTVRLDAQAMLCFAVGVPFYMILSACLWRLARRRFVREAEQPFA